MRARYYSTRILRFTSRDPVGGQKDWIASFNKYSYAANTPLILVDPEGLVAEMFVDGVGHAIANGFQRNKVGGTNYFDGKGNWVAATRCNVGCNGPSLPFGSGKQPGTFLPEGVEVLGIVAAASGEGNPFGPVKDPVEHVAFEVLPRFQESITVAAESDRAQPTTPWLRDPLLSRMFLERAMQPGLGLSSPFIGLRYSGVYSLFGFHFLNLRIGKIHFTYDWDGGSSVHIDETDPDQDLVKHTYEAIGGWFY